MSWRTCTKNAAIAQRMRAECQRRGTNMSGDKLWTETEDDLMARLYKSDKKRLRKLLTGRTDIAIQNRAAFLKVNSPLQPWTSANVMRLVRLYRRGSKEELLAAFPGRTWKAISTRALRSNAKGPLPEFRSPKKIVNEIRKRAALNFSVRELDLAARTGGYFRKRGYRHSNKLFRANILKAIDALDGQIQIVWRD